jgi:hypothetical protein
MKKLFRLNQKWNRKKVIIGPKIGQKIGHTVFCECYKEFSSDWAQIFSNYSRMCDLSLIIARCWISEHRPSQWSPKKPGFCPEMASFEKMRTFWRKTKVIFGITSSSSIESYITRNVSQKKSWLLCPTRFWKIAFPYFLNATKSLSAIDLKLSLIILPRLIRRWP